HFRARKYDVLGLVLFNLQREPLGALFYRGCLNLKIVNGNWHVYNAVYLYFIAYKGVYFGFNVEIFKCVHSVIMSLINVCNWHALPNLCTMLWKLRLGCASALLQSSF